MKWEPIIKDETTKEHILARINAIANELVATTNSNPDLIGSNAGISLFWEYFFLYSKNQLHHDYCIRLINNSLDAIAYKPMSYNLSGGVSGILWAYSNLVNNKYLDINLYDVIGDDINQFLLDSSKSDIQRFNYDYLHGGTSTLPYFLERADNEFCRNIINEIIIELEKIADKSPEGVVWMEGFHFISDKVKRYNLGMAHGMPSLVVLLSRVLEKNIASEKANQLLEGLISWMLPQKQQDGTGGFYPTVIPSQPPYFSRVSWCYGDLGIAIAFLQASMVTNNNLWREEAIRLAKNAAMRRKPNAGAGDTCFCHGTVGNAHIFNRLYHYTGIKEFKEAAIYWFLETLSFYETNKHFKFFMVEEDGSDPRWEYRAGILEGIAGTGLSFLAAISDIEPKWDRCFLLS